VLSDPVGVAVTPALLVGPVEPGLNGLDLACVVFDVQGRGADAGVGVLLQALDLAAEALVERESGGAWADAVQYLDLGLRVGGAEPGEDGSRIRRGRAALSRSLGHGRTLRSPPSDRETLTALLAAVAAPG